MDLKTQRILVTGACGTVGSELIRQLLEDYHVKELVALDNNEGELVFAEEKFSRHPQAAFFLADVRDRDKLSRRMKGIDVNENDFIALRIMVRTFIKLQNLVGRCTAHLTVMS